MLWVPITSNSVVFLSHPPLLEISSINAKKTDRKRSARQEEKGERRVEEYQVLPAIELLNSCVSGNDANISSPT